MLGHPWNLETFQSLGFTEAREAFWGRGGSVRLLLTMGVQPPFSFREGQLRDCSTAGPQEAA